MKNIKLKYLLASMILSSLVTFNLFAFDSGSLYDLELRDGLLVPVVYSKNRNHYPTPAPSSANYHSYHPKPVAGADNYESVEYISEQRVNVIAAGDTQYNEPEYYRTANQPSQTKKPVFNSRAQRNIYELEFKDALLIDVIRALSEQTGVNIIATQQASENRVTIFLRNVSVKEAIESICRINGLWYRQDNGNGAFRIMTVDEFKEDLVVYRDQKIKVFRLLNPNVRIIAQSIQDLFGPRVLFTEGLDPAQEQQFVQTGGGIGGGGIGGGGIGGNNRGAGGGRNNRNNRGLGGGRNNRNNRGFGGRRGGGVGNRSFAGLGGANGQNADPESTVQGDLSVDQIEALGVQNNIVTGQSLESLTTQASPIYVTTNNEHNLLIIRASDQEIIDQIAVLVEQLDRPVPQVLLEMKVLDITIDDDFGSLANVGLSIGDASFDFISNLATGGSSFFFQYISDNVLASLNLLIQKNRINVLSKPVIMASNNRPAQLFVGEETILTTGASSDVVVNQTGTTNFITTNTEVRNVGNLISITPFINDDNTITLALQQETSSVNEDGASVFVSNGATGVTEIPVDTVNTAFLNGTIVAKHGYTMAVGGLIRDAKTRNITKTPVLGDIPVVGGLFRDENQGELHRELVLIITPYLVRSGTDSVDVTRKRLLDPSKYPEWQMKQVIPEFIQPRQELPGTIEEDLRIYEKNEIPPQPETPSNLNKGRSDDNRYIKDSIDAKIQKHFHI